MGDKKSKVPKRGKSKKKNFKSKFSFLTQMRIDKKERNIILGIILILSVWFAFFLNKYYELANGNTLLFYALFLFAYSFLISKFFFGDGSIKAILMFLIVLITSDLLLPPYILVSHALPILTDNIKLSSDYFIYSLFPSSWSHTLKYYLTYIGFPVLMWSILALLFERKKFMSLFKSGL